MAVNQEVKFKSSDGRAFDNEAEAQKHDVLITARQEYKAALRKLNHCIAETTRTADGHLFEFDMWTTYYYVTPGFFDMPQLAEVPYLGWNWDLNEYDDAVEIVTREGDDQRRREYKIGSLYREKKKAHAALIEAQKQWLIERRQRVEDNEARFKRGEDPTRS